MARESATVLGRVTVGEALLAYDLSGDADGLPLVLVHAGIADRRLWDGDVAAFAPRHLVVRYDLRGFGQSTKPPVPYAHHEDLRAVLDAAGVSRAVVLGLSLGARIALDFALAFPTRTSALVLAAPALGGHVASETLRHYDDDETAALERGDIAAAVELNLRMWLDGPLRAPGDLDPTVRARARELLHHTLALPLVPVRPQWLDPPAHTRLGEVRAPTLVLVGDRDIPDTQEIAQRLAGEIPGAQLVVISGAAHLLNLEQPATFHQAVSGFLGTLRALPEASR